MEAPAQKNSSKKTLKKSFINKLKKVFLFFIGSFVLLLVILFFFIQTDFFNKILLSYTIKEINDSWRLKESRINVESIDGNILTGLRLNNGDVTVKGDTLLKFGFLDVKYDILGLLNKEIILSQVVLIDPQINITKVKVRDSLVWNFEHLFAAEEEVKDTAVSEFDWGVVINDLKIHNGYIRILEKKPSEIPIRKIEIAMIEEFNLTALDINNLEVDLNARYFPDSKNLYVKNISFSTNSDLNLKKLAFELKVLKTDTITEIRNLEIITDRTNLSAELIYMNRFNPFEEITYENFKDNNVKINLVTEKFNFDDLTFFLPDVNFLDGAVSLDLKAEGKYGDLGIEKLVLKTDNSYYNFKGRVKNLHEPSKLYLDITAQDLVIDPSDTKVILPGLPIPDYSHVGKVYADFKYLGEPLNFATHFDIKSSSGNANGFVNLDLTSANYHYKGIFEASAVNIGRIIKDKELESFLNLKADITGSGFNLNNLSTRVNYEITNSKIFKQNITKSAGVVDIHNYNIDADVTYSSGQMQSSIKGKVNISNMQSPEYTLRGAFKNLDISSFTQNPSDESNLSFNYNIKGRGITLDNIDGIYDFNFDNSNYDSYNIPATPVNIKINSSHSGGSVTVLTDIFDFKANGKFNLAEIAEVIEYNVSIITDEIDRKINESSEIKISSAKNFSNFNFEYEFVSKNARQLGELFKAEGLKFEGNIKGNFNNSNNEFSSLTVFNIEDFGYRDTVLALKKFAGRIDFKNDYLKFPATQEGALYPLTSNVFVKGEKIVYGSWRFDSASADFNLNDAMQSFQVRGSQDTSMIVNIKGNAEFGKNLIGINLDSLTLKYNKLELNNEDKLIVKYNPVSSEKTFTFEQFNIKSSDMKVKTRGDFSLAGNSDVSVEAKAIKVSDIIEFLYQGDSALYSSKGNYYSSPVKGNIRRLSVNLTGNLKEPIISLEMNSDLLRYEKIKLGRIDAFIDYKDAVMNTDILVSNAQGRGSLRLTGDIPIENPFGDKGYTSILKYPVNFKLNAKDFQINLFSKIIPNFAEIRGFLNGEIVSKGTVSEPILSGDMNITKGRFFLGITGLYYRFNTNLRTQNSDLIVERFQILNEDDDRRHIDVYGKINFEGLKINDIDLSTSGDIVVLDKSSEVNELGFNGYMIAGVGSPPVTLKGNLDKLYLEGQFLIKSANLTFPSLLKSSYDIYSDNFVYKTITDTTGTEFRDTIIIISPDKLEEVDPFLRSRYVSKAEQKSTRTNIIYDLNVKTTRNAYVSIKVNEATKEELFGEIKADIDIDNKIKNDMRVFGNVDFVGDSYYRFYRNFKVRDSRISFNGPPDNPELNIHAVYETKRTVEEIGISSTEIVKVILEIKGNAYKPVFTLKLVEDGTEIHGTDAQSNAISYLLFGVPKSQLSPGLRSDLAKNIGVTTGSTFLSSLLFDAVRTIAPFIVNAEVNYTEGDLAKGTNVKITSEFGDAIVKLGGRVFSDLTNTEVSVEYPLNKLFNIDVSNNLVLEISRTADFNTTVSGDNRTITTGIKILYIIRY